MNYLDLAIVLLLLASVLLAFWKGFVEQALSLAGWVVAFLAATHLGHEVAPVFAHFLADPGLQLAVAYLVIALVVWLASKVVSKALATLVQKIGLGKLDRLLGILFGVIRGFVLVLLLVAIASLTDLRFHNQWQTSQLMPYFEQVRDRAAAHLDDYISE
ncbi:CvpA family protein [Marinospirillum sp. MEB164]|uniref:CvpA family protein n=1 Tax=Marinospirillum alkalitolerans TaxID=3123374 RepID=A0ABW8PZC7_9GAMM